MPNSATPWGLLSHALSVAINVQQRCWCRWPVPHDSHHWWIHKLPKGRISMDFLPYKNQVTRMSLVVHLDSGLKMMFLVLLLRRCKVTTETVTIWVCFLNDEKHRASVDDSKLFCLFSCTREDHKQFLTRIPKIDNDQFMELPLPWPSHEYVYCIIKIYIYINLSILRIMRSIQPFKSTITKIYTLSHLPHLNASCSHSASIRDEEAATMDLTYWKWRGPNGAVFIAPSHTKVDEGILTTNICIHIHHCVDIQFVQTHSHFIYPFIHAYTALYIICIHKHNMNVYVEILSSCSCKSNLQLYTWILIYIYTLWYIMYISSYLFGFSQTTQPPLSQV